LKDGLTEPVTQQINYDIDNGFGRQRLVFERHFITAPSVEWNAHGNFLFALL
jgi:hypothetical protein